MADRLTRDELLALRETVAQMTPGEWRAPTDFGTGYVWGPNSEMVADDCNGCAGVRIRGVGGRLPMKENARGIVALRNAAERLLAAALELDEMHRTVQSYRHRPSQPPPGAMGGKIRQR